MASDSIVIAIDLGTTNFCAGYYIDGQIHVLENSEGSRLTPSLVYFTEEGGIIVGEYAKPLTKIKPQNGVYEIKKLIGKKLGDENVEASLKQWPFKVIFSEVGKPFIEIGDKTYTPIEITSYILRKVKRDVERKLNKVIREAVITVPAHFNINQRKDTLLAAEKTGITVLKLLNETTAAAFNYWFRNKCDFNEYCLIYHLDGSAFDVAILKKIEDKIETIGVDSDTNVGSYDFDNELLTYHKIINNTIQIIDRCLNKANLSKSKIKDVILVGISTRKPGFKTMLSEYFEYIYLHDSSDVDECVVTGAAVHAAMLSEHPNQKIDCFQITDVIPKSLGIVNFVGCMVFIIKKNTKIPIEQSVTCQTIQEQTAMYVDIYQGEQYESTKNCFLFTCHVEGLPSEAPGACNIIFTYSIDLNGILQVTAKMQYRNNIEELNVKYIEGYKCGTEIKSDLDESQEDEEDKKFKVFAEKKAAFLKYFIKLLYNLKVNNLISIHPNLYKKCREAIISYQNLQINNKNSMIEDFTIIKSICQPLIDKYNFDMKF